jgi:large subunit ribosomal protein L24e
MVIKTEPCSFTEYRIYPGRGRKFAAKDGKVYYFITTKAASLFHQRKKAVKLTWTQAWRRFNKKTKVDEITRRRTRKTTRVQKAIVGMSLDEIKRRRAEKPEEREKKME